MQKSLSTEEQPICADVWRDKYRYENEPDYDSTCERVIAALCARESAEFKDTALRAMQAREIVPAGRILAGAGTNKRVTLINCFVSPDIQDSMQTHADWPGKGIMDALSVAAYSLQMGGGIGMDFSTIRPRGAVVKRTSSVSSGVLPFMDMWHYMSSTIMSAGHRRGAMMGTLRCDHPDIEEFIEAKKKPGRLTNFNVSILVTDAFMNAVARDEQWALQFAVPRADDVSARSGQGDSSLHAHAYKHVYKRVSARELWNKIISSTYVHAEPGVIFIDRVNQLNNLSYCEEIHCTNPCGEQPLPANGDCNLGHTNLAVMVEKPFTSAARFDFSKLRSAASIMVRLLDNVLDVTLWPIPEQAEEARLKRRVGLGFTGLGSALQQLNIPYGSAAAVDFMRQVAREQAYAAYTMSCMLAKERGAFPLYDRDKFLAAPFLQKFAQDGAPTLLTNIKKYGLRNGVLLTVAPTGTTSLVIGNVSSGIEPVFAHKYRRKVLDGSGDLSREYSVYDYGYLKFCRSSGLDPEGEHVLPRGFVTTEQLTVEQHLQMAAAAQEWTDASISKTINCPENMTMEQFQEVYTRAYALGLKGCTTYRPNKDSGRGAVLEVAKPAVGAAADASGKIPMLNVADGRRYRIKWPTEDCSYYIIITDYADSSGRRRPFELFVSTKSERHSEWVKAFSLLVTAIFRREGDPSFVVDELRSVFSASGGAWVSVPWASKPKLATSLVAAIGLKIEEHLRWLGLIAADEAVVVPAAAVKEGTMPMQDLLDVCDKCGARAVVYSEGCATCHACGTSDCG